MSPPYLVLSPDNHVSIPFQNGSTFYCNLCQTYNDDFCLSHIRHRIKQCRPCTAEKRKRHCAQQTPTERLKDQLYKQLAAQGKMAVARGISLDTINEILRENGIDDPSRVLRILAPRSDSMTDFTKAINYNIEYKTPHKT